MSFCSFHYYFSIKRFTNGLSLESEWQQVSSNLQGASEDFTDFNNKVFWMISIFILISNPAEIFFKDFENRSKRTNYNLHHHHPLVPEHFQLSSIILSILIWEFFPLELADGFQMEFGWQQVSSCLQDFSYYFGRLQQCYSLHLLHSSSYFLVLLSQHQSVTVPSAPIRLSIIVTSMFHSLFFQVLASSKYFSSF